MLYRLGDLSRAILSTRNIILYLIFLVIANILVAAGAPRYSNESGSVKSTVPREFFETSKENPYKVKSSCNVTVEYARNGRTEIRQILDTGCRYKPGDKIDSYNGGSSIGSLRSIIVTVIFGFIIVVLLALGLPKHPIMNPRG